LRIELRTELVALVAVEAGFEELVVVLVELDALLLALELWLLLALELWLLLAVPVEEDVDELDRVLEVELDDDGGRLDSGGSGTGTGSGLVLVVDDGGHSVGSLRIGVRFKSTEEPAIPFETWVIEEQLSCRKIGRKTPFASWIENSVRMLWSSHASHQR
jgi:hypothetical protein